MNALNGQDLQGARLEISLAKVFDNWIFAVFYDLTCFILILIKSVSYVINVQPPSDKKKKEEMLRKREQRMMQAMAERLV